MPAGFELRPATEADLPEILATFMEGLETYRAFAPSGWEPLPAEKALRDIRTRLADAEAWWAIAERSEGGGMAGHVTFMPAARARRPESDPSLAHLLMLFVRRRYWGTGLATRLHAAALEAASERGYRAMRLLTPAGQARARRFYEREGWAHDGESFEDPEIGFGVVVYRRSLAHP